MSRQAIGLLPAALIVWSLQVHGDIRFEDVTETAGVSRTGETYGASWGDLDGDGYPDLFVSNHRLMPSLFLNTGEGDFIDVAAQTAAWVERPTADTHGATWFDFDNDGDQDLLVAVGQGRADQFLVNEGGALFDRSEELGVAFPSWGGRLPVWFDYDGDGLADFVMTQMAGIARLMRQLPSGGFEEQTEVVNMVCEPAQYGQLLDVNGDGRLELMCPQDAAFPGRIYDTLAVPWDNLTSRIGPRPGGPDSVIADFDNDGRMDVFLLGRAQLRPSGAVQSGPDRLEAMLMGGEKGFRFVSGGSVTFVLDWNELALDRIRVGAGAVNPGAVPFTLDPGDPAVAGLPAETGEAPVIRIGYEEGRWTVVMRTIDEDDETVFSNTYFQISSTAEISELENTGLAFNDGPSSPTLLLNRGGSFEDATESAGLAEPIQCVSAAAGDFDNDTHVDLYLACRTGASNIENILYRNRGDGSFERIAQAGGAPGPVGAAVGDGAGTADSVVVADYDVDGFLDLFVTNGLNMRPLGVGGPNRLYRNQGNGNHWIQVDLAGTRSHREAVGARVTARASGVTQARVKDGGYHRWSHGHTRMHFGLGAEDTVDLTIHWPSGTVETHADLPADRAYLATEEEGIVAIALGEAAAPYPCGLPPLETGVQAGLFIARDCRTGAWMLRGLDGGSEDVLRFTGRLVASAPFGEVTPVSLEDSDVLDTSEPAEIVYEFNVSGGSVDGIDFFVPEGVEVCVHVELPQGIEASFGPQRRPLPAQFDLRSTLDCGSADPPGNPPGPPGGNGSGGGSLGPGAIVALILVMAACGRGRAVMPLSRRSFAGRRDRGTPDCRTHSA